MDDDNRLSRTNEKKILMTNKNKKNCVLHAHFNAHFDGSLRNYSKLVAGRKEHF